MAKGLEAATFATAVKDGERRTSQSGNNFAVALLVTESGETDENGKHVPVFLRVLGFGDLTDTVGGIQKGQRVYLEGSLSLGIWHGDNGPRLNASVKAYRFEPMAIGRNKSRRNADEAQEPVKPKPEALGRELDDAIPF